MQTLCDEQKRKNQELDVVEIASLEQRLADQYALMTVRNKAKMPKFDE